VLEIVAWSGEYAGAPTDAVASFRGAHESLIASVDAVSARATGLAESLEALVAKCKESDAASKEATKAAGNAKMDEAARKTLDERAERLSAEAEALTRSTMRAMVKEFGSMNVELYTILASAADKQAAMLEAQFPVSGPVEGLPFEELWDEARPATGAKAAKAPPSSDGTKRRPHEELRALSRPVDGDTRIKYAKVWNGIVRDLVKPIREGNTQWIVYAQLRAKFAAFFVAWAAADEDTAAFTAAAEALRESEARFTDTILVQYQADLEGAVQRLEAHVACVPVVNAAAGEPDATVPPRRPEDAKAAILIATKAAQTLAESCKRETIEFGQTAMPTLPAE
jgi:hypothetical protein